MKTYEPPVLAGKMADWEKAKASAIVNRWAILSPSRSRASGKALLTKEPDGSIVGLGRQHEWDGHDRRRDRADRHHGLRLEVLPDSRLPSKGPGRASDGNFVLNEIAADRGPARPTPSRPSRSSSRSPWPISARRATGRPGH